MSVCQIEERDAGRPYPRTCPTCKLTGPCAKGLDRKAMAARIEALTAERDALAEKLARAIEALDPFSVMAGVLFAMNAEKEDEVLSIQGRNGDAVLTFEAFLKARTTLAAIKEGGE